MNSQSKLISLLVPAKAGVSGIDQAIEQLDAFFCRNIPHSYTYEIIIIFNGVGASVKRDELIQAHRLRPRVRILALNEPGKGRALKHGYQASHGEWIFLTDIDLPYDLSFFLDAIPLLRDGCDFVSGNRRLPDSTFTIPTSLLPLVFKRHRLGIYFNRIVARFLLGIPSGDTQAGIKAMSKNFASAAFTKQMSQGFLADLEFHMVCLQNGFKHLEIPIHFYLRNEKSTVQLSRQFFETLSCIPRLIFGRLTGFYRLQKRPTMGRFSIWKRILWFSWGQHANLKLFLLLRWILTPYSAMERRLPRAGKVLDLGCGHGLMTILIAMLDQGRKVEGWDHDSKRISVAAKLGDSLSNLTFKTAGLLDAIEESFQAVTMIDVLHYFSEQEQQIALRRAWEVLEPGGVLLFREINQDAGLKGKLNRLYEKFATFSGFTKSKNESVHYRRPEDWKSLAESCGFNVFVEKCSSFLFADILFICHKPKAETRPLVPWRMTADDWGMSPGINRGILDLAKAGVIHRVSVMADGPAVTEGLQELLAIKNIEIGMHFSLTDSTVMRSPRAFLKFTWHPFRSSTVKRKFIEREFQRQLYELWSKGIKPVYLDGHHHVHIFPQVARCLAGHELAKRTFSTVRIPLDKDCWKPKQMLLGLLSMWSRLKFQKQGWQITPFDYPLGADLMNPLHLSRRLLTLSHNTEVIFHPSALDDLAEVGSVDSYRQPRVEEYKSLLQLPAVLAYLKDIDASSPRLESQASIPLLAQN